MAFQKTKGRSVFTQPVGMPDLSGFKQAARSYQQLGSLVTQFGTDIRKREYNDAIRQAEIDGDTAGVRYEKDENGMWKLQPLVNLDYSKAVSHLPSVDREGVLTAYRKAALNSYTAAAENDIKSAANISLIENKNNPDGVRGAMNGYIDGMRESMPNEAFLQLAPKVEAAFMASENQALAQQQKEADEASIKALTKKFSNNTRELGNLYAVGDVDDAGLPAEGFQMRIEELSQEDEVTLESLSTLGLNDTELLELQEGRKNHIAQRVGSSFIRKTWIESEGDLEKTLTLVGDLVDQAQLDESIDIETFRTTLTNEATRLDQLDRAREAEDSERRNNIFQDFQYKLYVQGENLSKYLEDPDSDIYKLEGSQIGSLLSVSQAKREEFINNQFNEKNALIKNWEQFMGTKFEKDIGKNFSDIVGLWRNGDLGFDKLAETRESYSAYLDKKFLEPNRTAVEVSLVRELGDGSSFTKDPTYFKSLGPELLARGVIGGKNAKWKDLTAYEEDISKYSTKYSKHITKMYKGRNALSLALAGVPVTEAEAEAIHDVTPNYKAVLPPDEQGNIQVAETNFVTDDEVLFQASVDAADRFANETNGLLLPEAKRIFKASELNPELADKSLRVLNQVITGMAMKSGKSQEVELNHFFDVNNFTESERSFFNLAHKIGINNAVAAREGLKGISLNKGLEKLLPNRPEGKRLEDAVDEEFDKTFASAMVSHDWWAFFNPKISEERQRQLVEFASSANIDKSKLQDAVIRSPEIREALKGMWLERWHGLAGQGSAESALLGAMQSLGKRFGWEEDKRTNQIYLVERPIIHYAQATVPGRRLNDGTIIPNVQINQEMIVQDVARKFLASGPEGAFRNPTLDEAVRLALDPSNSGASNISFHANMGFGGEPTYTVIVTDQYDHATVIAKDYTYNFGTSVQNEFYQKAMDSIQTSKIKEFWSAYGLFDQSLIQSVFENYNHNGNDMSLNPMIKAFNELRLSTSPGASPEFLKSLGEPLKPEEVTDLIRLWNNIISWGKL